MAQKDYNIKQKIEEILKQLNRPALYAKMLLSTVDIISNKEKFLDLADLIKEQKETVKRLMTSDNYQEKKILLDILPYYLKQFETMENELYEKIVVAYYDAPIKEQVMQKLNSINNDNMQRTDAILERVQNLSLNLFVATNNDYLKEKIIL